MTTESEQPPYSTEGQYVLLPRLTTSTPTQGVSIISHSMYHPVASGPLYFPSFREGQVQGQAPYPRSYKDRNHTRVNLVVGEHPAFLLQILQGFGLVNKC